jgi:hypothetical protein
VNTINKIGHLTPSGQNQAAAFKFYAEKRDFKKAKHQDNTNAMDQAIAQRLK